MLYLNKYQKIRSIVLLSAIIAIPLIIIYQYEEYRLDIGSTEEYKQKV
jgi:hypothetical protein